MEKNNKPGGGLLNLDTGQEGDLYFDQGPWSEVMMRYRKKRGQE